MEFGENSQPQQCTNPLYLKSTFPDAEFLGVHTMRTGLPEHAISRIHMQELFRKLNHQRLLLKEYDFQDSELNLFLPLTSYMTLGKSFNL
jgi:hypothetical protein